MGQNTSKTPPALAENVICREDFLTRVAELVEIEWGLTDKEIKFVDDMYRAADNSRFLPSERQWAWMQKIAAEKGGNHG